MTTTEYRAEQPKPASLWAPKYLGETKGWVCERPHYDEQGAVKAVEQWGAYVQAPGGKRMFRTGHFPQQKHAAEMCDGLNGDG